MNKTNILDYLVELRNCFDIEKLDKLIEDIKEDIKLETVSNLSDKKALKSTLNFMHKKNNRFQDCYMIHSKTDNIDYQVVTDSFSAFYFKEHRELDCVENEALCSSLEKLLPQNMYAEDTFKIDYKKVVNSIKIHKLDFKNMNRYSRLIIVSIKFKDQIIYVDANKLKDMFNILGTDDIQFYFNGDILKGYCKNGNKGLLFRVKIDDTEEEIFKIIENVNLEE